jgi:hypothetical protein
MEQVSLITDVYVFVPYYVMLEGNDVPVGLRYQNMVQAHVKDLWRFLYKTPSLVAAL